MRYRLCGQWPALAGIAGFALLAATSSCHRAEPPAPVSKTTELKYGRVYPWKYPDDPLLPIGEDRDLVIDGIQIMDETDRTIGPKTPDPKLRLAGNNLSCSSCHINAGRKAEGLGLVGVAKRYPQFSARLGAEQTLEGRINGCMKRSMNGRPLPEESRPMRALVAYMNWLSRDVGGGNVAGDRLPDIPLLSRAADPAAGRMVYEQHCSGCHGTGGQGLINQEDPLGGYYYPPLWGSDSYNTGAGMHRLIVAAEFIKKNMPPADPRLSVEQAFDAAAFIESQKRPVEPDTAADYPDRSLKPVDVSYPPYADSFSVEQHTYGPFGPILEANRPKKKQ